jgi:hypothetical protein
MNSEIPRCRRFGWKILHLRDILSSFESMLASSPVVSRYTRSTRCRYCRPISDRRDRQLAAAISPRLIKSPPVALRDCHPPNSHHHESSLPVRPNDSPSPRPTPKTLCLPLSLLPRPILFRLRSLHALRHRCPWSASRNVEAMGATD